MLLYAQRFGGMHVHLYLLFSCKSLKQTQYAYGVVLPVLYYTISGQYS